MAEPAKLYGAIGRDAGCRALATAFYARVAQDPVLRPLFPSTFTCAIEEFSAFLVQFLGGEAEAMQRRWWLSLRESHNRFALGQRERNAWMGAMTAALGDSSVISNATARGELLEFFRHASSHVVNKGRPPEPEPPLKGELSPLWAEQLALDEAVALIRDRDQAARCIEVLQTPVLQARFARSPAVHASIRALAAKSKSPALRDYRCCRGRSAPIRR